MTAGHHALARIVRYFETLTPGALARLGEVYAADARFIDPLHELDGLAAIERMYARMFDSMDGPRFRVETAMASGSECLLVWEFRFALRGGAEQRFMGVSQLVLDGSGRIASHRDFWDAGEAVYERIPVLRAALRWLKRRLAA